MKCRDGHESAEPDFCSVCGIAMDAGGSTGPAAATGGAAGTCPSCGEPRVDSSARFCEVCRFDFVAKKSGPPPVASPARDPAPTPVLPKVAPPPSRSATSSQSSPTGPVQWELAVTVDPSLDTEPDPATPVPADTSERVFPFDRAELLVGRQDDRRDIHPELELADPGASRRHAKFVRMADGGVALQDLASTNGTKLNGTDVAPGSRHPLREGDRVTLGRWTSIVLRGRA